MRKIIGNRSFILGIVIVLFCCVLVFQLVNLQIVTASDSVKQAESRKEKVLSVRGERGKIYDSNMVPMAYDEACYNVEFYRDPNKNKTADRAEYTRTLLAAIDIIESNGFSTVSTFYMGKDETGQMQFNWRTENEEAMASREKYWRANFYLGSKYDDYTPQELYDYLLEYFGVPEGTSYETQIKVLSIWQEAQAVIYLSSPVVIAQNVNLRTVSEIEARSTELSDISIAKSSMRVYPQNETAAHIVGYIGAMSSQETIDEYKELGYSATDKIGVAGIERTMENQLSSNVSHRQGSRTVEINNLGRIMRELPGAQEPINGNSIVLTIDLELQRFVEEALQSNIEKTQKKEIDEKLNDEDWLEENAEALELYAENDRDISLAMTGAAIVMDVNSGKVLAMASNPSYDPNVFIQGDLDAINAYLAEDSNQPLFNRAISTKDTPGSIFKMATGLAALMEGVVSTTETIYDETKFLKYLDEGASDRNAPTCWSKRESHGEQDIVRALENSCNYYFFEVTHRMGIDALYKWAHKLGLGSKTGIELPGEERGVIAHKSALYDTEKTLSEQDTFKPRLAANKIKEILVRASEKKGMEYDAERFDTLADSIMDLAVSDKDIKDLAPDVREILLTNSGLSASEISSQGLVTQILEYLRDIKWTANESMWAAIGQSIHQHTPIAVARYIAAIVNGGVVYEAQLVDRILDAEGEVITDKQPVMVTELEGAEEYLKKIKDGMSNVVNSSDEGRGSTAKDVFSDFEYKDNMGGKTGTAEKSDLDVENNAWFVAFAPFEEPEIAVVVYIPSGLAGSDSGWCVRDIIEYWMDQKAADGNEIPDYGILVP